MSTDRPEPETTPTGLLTRFDRLADVVERRVGRRPPPLALLGLLIGIVALPPLAVAGWFWNQHRTESARRAAWTVADALAAYDRGDYAEARDIAELLVRERRYDTADAGGAALVLGAIASRQADLAFGEVRRRHRAVAARWLQEAETRGFPPGRRTQGYVLLGRNLLLAGQATASQAALRQAIDRATRPAPELFRMLAMAYAGEPNPQLERAQQALTEYLAIAAEGEAQQRGWLQLADVQLRLNDEAGCRESLAQVTALDMLRSERLLLDARLLMRQANAANATAEDRRRLLGDAVARLREAQEFDTLGNQSTPTAMYLIGICYQQLADPVAALGQFERTSARFDGYPEGVAARYQSARLLAEQGRDVAALEAWGDVVRQLGPPEQYANPWLPLDDLRRGAVQCYQRWVAEHHNQPAIELARLLAPLLGDTRSTQLVAEAYAAWGEHLRRQADAAPADEATALRDRAGYCLREAAMAHRRLADLRFADREYSDELWNAARLFAAGQDYRRSIEVLDQYLAIETRPRRAAALTLLGEALLAGDQFDEASTVLRQCMADYPRDPAAYESRLLLAPALAERGQFSEAEFLLDEILSGELLTPASREWRSALFLLGELLVNESRYADALVKLDEAVSRYPADRRALEARYLVALAHRRLAEGLLDAAAGELVLELRVQRRQQAMRHLESALVAYQQVLDQADAVDPRAPRPADVQALSRNSQFAVPVVLYELGRFDDAIVACQSATNRYQEMPEVLNAYVQMAACYRRIDKPIEARATLEQAKVVLARLPASAQFQETTNYSRDQWQALISALATL